MTPWNVAHQAPLFTGFSRQVYCSGRSFPTAGDPPSPGIELVPLVYPALAGGFFTTEPPGKSQNVTLFGNRAFVHVDEVKLD